MERNGECMGYKIPASKVKSILLAQRAYNFEQEMRERFKEKWPPNYRHIENRIILVDNNDTPIFTDNGDGTVSGFKGNLIRI